MAFKEDWSFLDKITMGAVGTESVITQLNAYGHQVIELERYCTSNKIWATKIKRLRIPDLLCLRCGKRIESRAKSKLGIIMSDAENNPERRWFAGLRQSDLVAFIQCHKNEQDLWEASNTLNLFGVGDMLSTEDQTVLSAPKSVYEGAERDRTWASYTPGNDFTVTAIENEDAGTRIRLLNGAARNQSKLVNSNQYIYVRIGDSFQAGEKIVSGIVPHTCDCGCTDTQYDFFEDLSSQQAETVYTAVKALGFLPVTDRAICELNSIATNENVDARIRLEAFASLLRLGEDLWEAAYNYVFSQESKEIKMEFALILGELHSLDAETLLRRIVCIDTNESELRAASIWSLPNNADALIPILMECFSTDSTVADHAIAKDIDALNTAYNEIIQFLNEKVDYALSQTSDIIEELCVDEELREEYNGRFSVMSRLFDRVLPNPAALEYSEDYKTLAFIRESVAKMTRNPRFSNKDASKKVRAIIEEYLTVNGVDMEIAPISLLSDDFLKGGEKKKSDRAVSEEIKYAVREFININMPKDPELYARLSERLEQILEEFKNNWTELRNALEQLRRDIKAGRAKENTYGYEATHEMPFLGLLKTEFYGKKAFEELSEEQMGVLKNLTDDVLSRFKQETEAVNFWNNVALQQELRTNIIKQLISPEIKKHVPDIVKRRKDVAQKLMELGYQHFGRDV